MLNDLGMLFVCGFFKHMNRNMFSTFLSRGSIAVTDVSAPEKAPESVIGDHEYD
jgi:hypothetical protein